MGTQHDPAAGLQAPVAPLEAAAGELDAVCYPPEITADNDSHDAFSVLSVVVPAYPGLFRVVAWVLNGLEVDVQNAELHTSEDGMAHDTFWLTEVNGKKLSNYRLDCVAERLSDFVSFCTPDTSIEHARKFSHGPITVDNSLDDKLSVITIFVDGQQQRLDARNPLLEVASCINGSGVRIRRAVIQSCSDCGVPVGDDAFHEIPNSRPGARLVKVWGSDREGRQLDHARATALIFTLQLLFSGGASAGSLSLPKYEQG